MQKCFKDRVRRFRVEQTFVEFGMKIPLPPLEVQEKIVAELDGYRKIIEGAKQIIANYKPTIRIDPDWPTIAVGDLLEEVKYTEKVQNRSFSLMVNIQS